MAKLTELEPVFYLDTSNQRFHFIILGVGGTGSDLVAKLCRHLSLLRLPDSNFMAHDITFCDADVVEEKNLVRQNFFPADLGKNKAEIMALKCATLFDMTVRAVPKYVEDRFVLENVIVLSPHVPFIVGCVDNSATRKMIHDYVELHNRPLFYLDAGNEEFSGQVALGYYGGFKSLRLSDSADNSSPYIGRFNLPDITYHHPEMLENEDKFASGLSCAERAVSNPQAMTANNEASTILFQIICNCLRGCIDYHYVAFDTLTSTRHVIFNTVSALKSYGVQRVDAAVTEITSRQAHYVNSDHLSFTVASDYDPINLARDISEITTEPEHRIIYNTTGTAPTLNLVATANRVLGTLDESSDNECIYQLGAPRHGSVHVALDPESSVIPLLSPLHGAAETTVDHSAVSEEISDDSITLNDLLSTGETEV